MGLQKCYTKFCYFLCESDSHAKSVHYSKNWALHKSHTPETKNVADQPLADPCKVWLPPLHINLGLMKNFVKALDRNGPAFSFLYEKFPRFSMEKIKAGVFFGLQIRQLFRDTHFYLVLSDDEKAAWNAFRHAATGFLGNVKAVNVGKLVENLITSYEKLGCNVSLKTHFLQSHLDSFPANCGAVSDEHGERFHQDISAMENRYKGKLSAAMLADYCWAVKRDVPEIQYKRQAKRRLVSCM